MPEKRKTGGVCGPTRYATEKDTWNRRRSTVYQYHPPPGQRTPSRFFSIPHTDHGRAWSLGRLVRNPPRPPTLQITAHYPLWFFSSHPLKRSACPGNRFSPCILSILNVQFVSYSLLVSYTYLSPYLSIFVAICSAFLVQEKAT